MQSPPSGIKLNHHQDVRGFPTVEAIVHDLEWAYAEYKRYYDGHHLTGPHPINLYGLAAVRHYHPPGGAYFSHRHHGWF